MSAGAQLGLDVAESRIERFEDETVIVVGRYDRRIDGDGTVARIHQEDLAQAAGIHPAGKYQNEGGPGNRQIVEIVRRSRGRAADASIVAFFTATLFNWAILGTDAHAKNYSLLHDADLGPRLAPLYDVASALPYPDLNNRRSRLAMSFDRRCKQFDIEPRHIFGEAASVGLDPDGVREQAIRIVENAPDAFAHATAAAGLSGDDALFAARLIDEVAHRSTRLRRELDAVRSARRPQTPAARNAQLRNKDVGSAGNAGAFAAPSSEPPSSR